MTTSIDPARIAHCVFPARKQKLPDGRWVITPGEPEMRVRTQDAVRISGIPSKTLHRLADAGMIRRAAVTANIVFWWPAEIEQLIERCSLDEGYARTVRFRADLKPEDLKPPPRQKK